MPLLLFSLAEKAGIAVEYYDLLPPILGLYWATDEITAIGLDRSLQKNYSLLRCVLAEELGHHFTTTDEDIGKTFYSQHDRIMISKAEYKALRWAALHLMPRADLYSAFDAGIVHTWELADYFNVTEYMVKFRCQLLPNC